MTTIVGSRTVQIGAGTTVTVQETATVLDLGPGGSALLRLRLVHPDPEVQAPLLYFSNPDRTINMDNEVLAAPITSVVRALTGSAVIRFDRTLADVVITEVWTASAEKYAIPAFFARQLYNYLLSPPVFNPVVPVFVQWTPQDKNAKTYNVELLALAIGSGSGGGFDFTEFIPPGTGATQQAGPLDVVDAAFEVDGSGLVDRPVAFSFKIVSEVV